MSLKLRRCELARKWLRGSSFHLECLHQIIAHYLTSFEGARIKSFDLKQSMYCLAALPNGNLASGSSAGSVHIWNTDGETLAVLKGHLSYVCALAVLCPTLLASASGDGTVKVWQDGVCIQTLKGHTNVLRALTVTSEGQLVSASEDTTIRVWDTATWECARVMAGHTKSVDHLAALPNNQLASTAWDHTVRVWNASSGACVRVIEGHTNYVCSLAALSNGKLATASWDRTLKVWGNTECELTIPIKEFSGYLTLCALPNGCLASVGVFDVTIYDAQGALKFKLNLGAFGCTATVVRTDGTLLALTNSGTAVLWE
jgi:WD40 repeat protein